MLSVEVDTFGSVPPVIVADVTDEVCASVGEVSIVEDDSWLVSGP